VNDGGKIVRAYSTGAVSGGNNSLVGGLIGRDRSPLAAIGNTYWDTDTSGITNTAQGAGAPPNRQGITALTTVQLQAGLPPGFHASVWGQSPGINGGFPYLLANPAP
jgi:hypothetical protein